jgi:8-oxo-dGTP pyrophosphatase MutT (NUDIX family)
MSPPTTALRHELSRVLLAPEAAIALDVHGRTDAAVLVALYLDAGRLHAVLTKRREDLRRHAGEISFPGGRYDETDSDLQATALREAEEEIGLAPALVEPLGYLDLYLTFSGFRILPVVARVDPSYRMVLNPAEVDDAFEVPLAFLMDVQNHALHSRDWKGVIRRYYAMPFGERYIWGVTAGILRNLYERIYLR